MTDLEFHRQSTKIIYASTLQTGVYISLDRAGNWLNLGTPEYNVFAISTSSLYAATQGGLLQCTGTGVIAGKVIDTHTKKPIDNARIFTDFGQKTICVNGEYMMVSPAGIFTVTTIADNHANTTVENVRLLGGDVTFTNISMESGIADPYIDPETNNTSSSSDYG